LQNEDISHNLKMMYSRMTEIILLLHKENKFLMDGNQLSALKFASQKESLIEELASVEAIIRKKITPEAGQKNQAIINKIKTCHYKINEATERNDILLRVNMEVNNKFIDLYKSKCVKATIDNFGYDNDGKNTAIKKLEKVMPSISLNSRI